MSASDLRRVAASAFARPSRSSRSSRLEGAAGASTCSPSGRIRLEGLPPGRTPAERVYLAAFPRVLDQAEPGGVDNQYLAWLFQYGVITGSGISLVWIGLLLWPGLRTGGSALVAARSTAVFAIVAASAVNIWEEFPTDLLVSLVLAASLAVARHASDPADPC